MMREMTGMIKYVVCPDFVISQTDGDRHWISASALIRLHGLNPKECLIVDKNRPETYLGREHLIVELPNFYPRYGGEYLNG